MNIKIFYRSNQAKNDAWRSALSRKEIELTLNRIEESLHQYLDEQH